MGWHYEPGSAKLRSWLQSAMSNHSYIDYLLDSYLRYHFFSSPNGSAGAQDYSRDGSQAISAVSGPPTAGAWEMRAGDGWVSTVQSNKIVVCLTYFAVRLIKTGKKPQALATNALHQRP